MIFTNESSFRRGIGARGRGGSIRSGFIENLADVSILTIEVGFQNDILQVKRFVLKNDNFEMNINNN